MICPHCKEGDTRYGHDFKNQAVLNVHIKHKHKDIGAEPAEPTEPVEPTDPVEPQGEPTKEELGILPNQEEGYNCSECGFDIPSKVSHCPNCGARFD